MRPQPDTIPTSPRRVPRIAAPTFRAIPVALALAATAFSALLRAGELSAQTALSVGRIVSGSISEGDTARHIFEAGEDYFVLGEVDQVSADIDVRVLGSDGETPWGNSSGPGRGAERFAVRPPEAGTYTVELTSDEGESADYTITLLRIEPLETDPQALTDQLMSRYDGEHSPGAAVQVWRDGETLYSKAYGMANLAYGIPFAADTRTNIGSTSKQFTAFAIMLQAERGLLSLDDDIRTHVPELPEFDHTITVRHLITHTSGLREFLNLTRMTGRRLDRGDWIDRSEIIDIVKRQPALQNEPGAEWNYNNTAFGLAAVIVERTSGQDFPTFMRENVFEPLGMTRTLVRPSPIHIVPEMSEGYTPGPDGFLQIGDLGGAAGAGGMYSTLDDLQTWVENYANPRLGSAEIFEEMMTSYVLSDGEETGYGYGLSVDEQRGLKRVHHGGADVAHRSMLAYYPEIDAGITTQSNHAGFNSSVAFELAEAFFADAMEPEDAVAEEAGDGAFDPADYDPEDFDDFAGRYALDETPRLHPHLHPRGRHLPRGAHRPAASRDGTDLRHHLRDRARVRDDHLPSRRGRRGQPHHPRPERPASGDARARRRRGARSRGAGRLRGPLLQRRDRNLLRDRAGGRRTGHEATPPGRRDARARPAGHVLGRRLHLPLRARPQRPGDRVLPVERTHARRALRAGAVGRDRSAGADVGLGPFRSSPETPAGGRGRARTSTGSTPRTP